MDSLFHHNGMRYDSYMHIPPPPISMLVAVCRGDGKEHDQNHFYGACHGEAELVLSLRRKLEYENGFDM